jgi:AcrR family transcriptional regulator
MAETTAADARGLGLRERKKRRTRELTAETARRLFAERGFDRVTVAEVAHAAEVSEQTVFNYFPTKEDLVYWRLETFEEDLLAAVRERAPGESVLDAFGRFVLEQRGLLAEHDPEVRKRLAELTRMITESRALLARERQIFERYTASLGALVAEETGARAGDVEPWVVANALIGVHRALIDYARGRILAGVPSARIRREVRDEGERALRALEHGLARYAVKPPAS